MRTIHRYILSSFALTFVLSLSVLTFILSIGGVFKLSELLARGVAVRPVLTLIASSIPSALAFSIPISALVSSLLVFGRLSSDGEITAMRACGISLWQVISRPAMFAVLLVALCLNLQNELAPRAHFSWRTLLRTMKTDNPLDLLEEGRFIQDFAGLTVYLGERDDDFIQDIRIFDTREDGVKRQIRARSGRIFPSTNGTDLVIDLSDVRIDPFYGDKPGFFGQWTVTIDDAFKVRDFKKRADDMTFVELRRAAASFATVAARDPENDIPLRLRMNFIVEQHKRLALSFAALTFVLLGVPLGIKAHRRESSVGIGISILLVFSFYVFIIIADSLSHYPAAHPALIAWLPVVLSAAMGFMLLRRGR